MTFEVQPSLNYIIRKATRRQCRVRSTSYIVIQERKDFVKFVLKILCMAFLATNLSQEGALGSVVVKALCYKPEGRGFDIG
jgi:hypothetical protein